MKRTIYIVYGPEGCGKTLNAEAFKRCFRAQHAFEELLHPRQLLSNKGDVVTFTSSLKGYILDQQLLPSTKWLRRWPKNFVIKIYSFEDAVALCRTQAIYVNVPTFIAARHDCYMPEIASPFG